MRITAPFAVVLDTTPLGLLAQKPGVTEADACKAWYASPPDALGSDVLIAAQASRHIPADFGMAGMIVATANPSHLSALTSAAQWSTTQP